MSNQEGSEDKAQEMPAQPSLDDPQSLQVLHTNQKLAIRPSNLGRS